VKAVTSASFYAPVEGELRELERRLLEVGRGAHPVFRDAVAHLFTTPGKLLRPTLVFLSSRFGPGEDREVVLNLAESLELVHTASLVHDDVVDRAQMRRNIQTVNAKWNDDVALIVGDYLFAKAYALAAVLPKPEVIAIVAQTVFALCDGELGEITATPSLPSETAYLDRIELKTASLYAACSQGAALLADAEPITSPRSVRSARASAWPSRSPTTSSISSATKKSSERPSATTSWRECRLCR